MKSIKLTLFLLLFCKSVFGIFLPTSTDSAMSAFNKGDFDAAQAKFTKIVSFEKNKDTLAKCYHYLGNIYYQKNDFVKSLVFFNNAIQVYTELNKTKNVANELNNIGLIYLQIGDLDKANSYILKSLNINLKLGETTDINTTYTNLYVIAFNKYNYVDAEKYTKESIKWSIKYNDTAELAKGYSNLGVVLMNTSKYDNALDIFNKSLSISKDSTNIAICFNNIGFVYYKIGNLFESDKYFNMSIDLLKRLKSFNYLKDFYDQLHELKLEKGDYKSSLEYFKLYIDIRDSLIDTDNKTMISKMITDYDNKFKTKERELQIKSLELEKSNAKQKIIFLIVILIVSGVSIVLIAFGFYKSWKNYNQKKKLSEELSISNKELGNKNKDITDSIQYAKRLQNGILGSDAMFVSNLKNSNLKIDANLLYIPKDIVSGDFYWSYYKDGNQYIAIGDCTGHGVPGSMITIVGHTSLSKIVEDKFYKPGDILTQLDKMVKSSFSGGSDIKDGMDITIIRIDKNGKLEFAGANNFIYLRRGNEFEVVKGDKFHVGAGDSVFTTKEISLDGVDNIYMMTDGVIDQFGGPNGKKLKQTGLKEMILNSPSFCGIVGGTYKWKEGFEQTDDITFLEINLK